MSILAGSIEYICKAKSVQLTNWHVLKTIQVMQAKLKLRTYQNWYGGFEGLNACQKNSTQEYKSKEQVMSPTTASCTLKAKCIEI